MTLDQLVQQILPIAREALETGKEENLHQVPAIVRPGARMAYPLITGPMLPVLIRTHVQVDLAVAQKALGRFVAPFEALLHVMNLAPDELAAVMDYLELLKTPASQFLPEVQQAVG